MKQTVTVIGPNLADQSKGQFHVHEYTCSDIGKYKVEEQFTIHAATRIDVVAETYDFLADDELAGALDEFHFAPCVTLPKEA